MKRLVSVCGGRLVSDPLTGQKFLTLRLPLVSYDVDEVKSGRNKLKSKRIKEAVAAATAAEKSDKK